MSKKSVRLDPSNAVIVDKDGKIIRNGIYQRCPHCRKPLLRGDTIPVWNVGATGKWQCVKCRKEYHTITLPVPVVTTPEEFYELIRGILFPEED